MTQKQPPTQFKKHQYCTKNLDSIVMTTYYSRTGNQQLSCNRSATLLSGGKRILTMYHRG
jgi:hypothetical protein